MKRFQIRLHYLSEIKVDLNNSISICNDKVNNIKRDYDKMLMKTGTITTTTTTIAATIAATTTSTTTTATIIISTYIIMTITNPLLESIREEALLNEVDCDAEQKVDSVTDKRLNISNRKLEISILNKDIKGIIIIIIISHQHHHFHYHYHYHHHHYNHYHHYYHHHNHGRSVKRIRGNGIRL